MAQRVYFNIEHTKYYGNHFFLASMHNFIETYKKQKIIYQFLLVKTIFVFHGIGIECMTGYFFKHVTKLDVMMTFNYSKKELN